MVKTMRIAMLSTIAWRTPPRHYGPYETIASLLTEGLVKRGFDVTLFATGDSITKAKLRYVCSRGYEEDRTVDVKVMECLHISDVFEHADDYDIIHNHLDFLPLTYTSLVTIPVLSTIQGFSSPTIVPVYEKYNQKTHYISISNASRLSSLTYMATIYHGISLQQFAFQSVPGNYLLYFARIHPDKGTKEAIKIAQKVGIKLIIAGLIHDREYFRLYVEPHIDNHSVVYVGSADPISRNTLMRGAYATLHPINFEEPFGLSVVESLACGTPVIAFNRGSMPEILEHGYNGFLVSNVEEAIEILKDIPLIDRWRCRETIEKSFTDDIMVENYVKIYNAVLQNNGNSHTR